MTARPLRVLMVTPRFSPETGGVERHVEEVAARAGRAGCAVTVLTTDRTGELPAIEERDGFTLRRVRAWPRGRDYHFAPGIRRVVGEGEWGVVHVQSYHTFVAPLAMWAAVRSRVPFVLTFHGGGHSSAARNRARGLQRRLLGPLLRRAAALVAVAEFEIDEYGEELGVPRERFRLIPNGVDPPPAGAAAAADPQEGPLIASIGRLERYKGHGRVLEALPRVLERSPDARLWIAGSGPYERELRERAAQLGVADRVRIDAVDDRAEMAERMRRADLVVLLSDFETHPLTVIEAASLGRPVLVADNSGMRELAARGLAHAIPTDSPPAAVADAILQQLATPPRVAEVELPTWDDCADALVRLYGEVAKLPTTR